MFRKEFRTKSECQLKNSERKQFKTALLELFPILIESELDFLFASKQPIYQSKIITHCNNIVYVYHVSNIPMVFKFENVMHPTVYFLWECPFVIPTITTHTYVIEKLKSGADLMTPGVIPTEEPGLHQYGMFNRNRVVSVNDINNYATLAVGVTLMSSEEMYMSQGRGKCVRILHTYDDNLSRMKGTPKPVPDLGLPIVYNNIMDVEDAPEDTVTISGNINQASSVEDVTTEDATEESLSTEAVGLDVPTESKVDISEFSDDEELVNILSSINLNDFNELDQLIKSPMDELFVYSFLKELKYPINPHTFPMLTSHFSKLLLMGVKTEMDIKKTTFKKFSNFYSQMAKLGVIQYGQKTKGVDSILSVNTSHKLYKMFKINEKLTAAEDIPKRTIKQQVVVEEKLFINAAVNHLFKYTPARKSDVVTVAFVQDALNEYVIKENLLDPLDPRMVVPNKEIQNAIKSSDSIDFNSLIEKICFVMGHSYRIVASDGSVVTGNGTLKTIDISTVIRSGKKITILENLSLYGVNLEELSKDLQHGVAASTTINKVKNKTAIVTVQGSHFKFISRLLNEKYGVPNRYVKNMTVKKDNKK